MAVYPYSTPALLALLAKFVILHLSRRAEVQGAQAHIFRFAVVLSILLNFAEITVLQKLSDMGTYLAAVGYYATSALFAAALVQLTVSISFENWKSRRLLLFCGAIYAYCLALFFLFIFRTPALITEIKDFRGYTVLGSPGPYYWLYETLLIVSMVLFLILPVIGIRNARSALTRGRCKLWLVGAAPFALVVIVIVLLLHAGFHWFNSTVTTPLLITLLLGSAGYATHCNRIVELDFYVPGSKARRFKSALYQKLANLGRELRALDSLELMLERVADALGCAVVLKFSDGNTVRTRSCGEKLADFPRHELRDVRRITLQNEHGISETTRALMRVHGVGAIVPFFPRSGASCWLLFGEHFTEHVYSASDFAALDRLLQKIAGLLLDSIATRDRLLGTERRINELEDGCRRLEAQIASQLGKLRGAI